MRELQNAVGQNHRILEVGCDKYAKANEKSSQ